MSIENLRTQFRAMRKEKRLTQVGLGYKVGCDGSSISRIENGMTTLTLSQFIRIAGALGINQVILKCDPACTSYADTSAWEVFFLPPGK